jgi:Ankyrin repeats (3 copies)
LLPTETDKWKRTALYYAVQWNNLEVVRFLLEEIGLSETARYLFNRTPLRQPARWRNVDIYEFLLEI